MFDAVFDCFFVFGLLGQGHLVDLAKAVPPPFATTITKRKLYIIKPSVSSDVLMFFYDGKLIKLIK